MVKLLGQVGNTLTEDEWKELRHDTIGASNVAAAHTGRYGGIYSVVASKIGHVEEVDAETQSLFDRGHNYEASLRGYTEAIIMREGYEVAAEQAFVASDENDKWTATLDGCLVAPGSDKFEAVWEAKTRTDVPGHPPPWDYYKAQVQWQMKVAGIDRALIVVAKFHPKVPGHDWDLKGIEHVWVDANEFAQTELEVVAERIAQHLEAGTLPAPTADNMAEVRAATSYGDDTAPMRDMGDYEKMAAEYYVLNEKRKTLAKEADELKAQLIEAMGDSTLGETPTHMVKYSKNSTTLSEGAKNDFIEQHPNAVAFSAKKARQINPDLYALLAEPVGSRKFTITRKGKS